jgi:hypothetical protein
MDSPRVVESLRTRTVKMEGCPLQSFLIGDAPLGVQVDESSRVGGVEVFRLLVAESIGLRL